MDAKNYCPAEDYLMIEPEVMPERVGNIVLPDRSRFTLGEGRVVKKGPNASTYEVGQGVVFRPNTDYKYDLDGKTICLVRESDVLLTY